MVIIVLEQHKEKTMEAAMTSTMYYKGAPNSISIFHRIPMNSVTKVDQLKDAIPMIICRTHMLHMWLH